MATKIQLNIDSGNGLLPDDTNHLFESMLTRLWWGSVNSSIHLTTISLRVAKLFCNEFETYTFWITLLHLPVANELKFYIFAK